MDKIHEIAGDGALMPRFDDGMVNMAELIRVMAESLVNEAMDARADEACEGGNRRNGYRERRLAAGVAPSTPGSRSCAPAATSPRTSSSGARARAARSSPRCPGWRPTARAPGRRGAWRGPWA